MKKRICFAVTAVIFSTFALTSCAGLFGGGVDVSMVKFEDYSVVYDGKSHKVEATNLPEGVTVTYENNEKTNAGEYVAKANLYQGSKKLKTLESKFSIARKDVVVTVEGGEGPLDTKFDYQYEIEGVLEGEDLGLTLYLDQMVSGIHKIEGYYKNKNYNVIYEGGEFLLTDYIMNNATEDGRMSGLLPSDAPVALYDSEVFAATVITSISFPFAGLAAGYTTESDNLYLPLYVISAGFTDKMEDCTEANGKKINLDFTGKLDDVKVGDWITIDDLHIEIGRYETLAIGDKDMAVIPQYITNGSEYKFWGKSFGNKVLNRASLCMKAYGYKTDTGINEGDAKWISFMGDSITTYDGWSNNREDNASIYQNAIWYPNNNANLALSETWWYRVVNGLGYKLCVNNAWSGSVVTDVRMYETRAKNLHNEMEEVDPDVIVILMGVNDYGGGKQLGDYDGTGELPDYPASFSECYGKMLETILATYKRADVYCCKFMNLRTGGTGLVTEQHYNAAIETLANHYGVNLIDLNSLPEFSPEQIFNHTVDGLHPNSKGMKAMADKVIAEIKANS